jgi:hypothetical protein
MTAFNPISNSTFLQIILFTDTDGRAKFREEALPMPEGNPQAMLSKLQPSTAQWGFAASFIAPPRLNGCSFWAEPWKFFCKTAVRAFFSPGIRFIQTIPCLQVQLLMPPFTATGVVKWATSRW